METKNKSHDTTDTNYYNSTLLVGNILGTNEDCLYYRGYSDGYSHRCPS